MIASLRGYLTDITGNDIILESGGIGFGISLPESSIRQLPALQSKIKLRIVTHVSQDAIRLYGFLSALEEKIFGILLGTSGVGPRLALSILSYLPAQELVLAVECNDLSCFRGIAGVGPKKAERLLLDLRGRLPLMKQLCHDLLASAQLEDSEAKAVATSNTPLPQTQEKALLPLKVTSLETNGTSKPSKIAQQALADVLSVLENLGFQRHLALEAAKKTQPPHLTQNSDLGMWIKEAIQLMTPLAQNNKRTFSPS